jgi:hypothetical protein
MSETKIPSCFIFPSILEEEEKLRKAIKGHRERRYASAYKKKMREMSRKEKKG